MPKCYVAKSDQPVLVLEDEKPWSYTADRPWGYAPSAEFNDAELVDYSRAVGEFERWQQLITKRFGDFAAWTPEEAAMATAKAIAFAKDAMKKAGEEPIAWEPWSEEAKAALKKYPMP